jgi:hypothetical protein
VTLPPMINGDINSHLIANLTIRRQRTHTTQ